MKKLINLLFTAILVATSTNIKSQSLILDETYNKNTKYNTIFSANKIDLNLDGYTKRQKDRLNAKQIAYLSASVIGFGLITYSGIQSSNSEWEKQPNTNNFWQKKSTTQAMFVFGVTLTTGGLIGFGLSKK